MTLSTIIPRISAWRNAKTISVVPLAGGVTNKNYRVDVDGESFVVRLSGANTATLGINRVHEYTATTLAASIGIAPEVITFLEPEGHLVTRFIHGKEWSWAQIRQPEVVERIAHQLHRVHALPSVAFAFSPFRFVEHYVKTAQAFGVLLPQQLPQIIEHMHRIEALEQADGWSQVFCHNDLVRRNFLDDGSVRILDWEYAGMNTPFFDLAILSENHHFNAEQEQLLLSAYFGTVHHEHTKRTKRMKYLFLLRDATWSCVQSAILKIDFDFAAYADHLFARLTGYLNE